MDEPFALAPSHPRPARPVASRPSVLFGRIEDTPALNDDAPSFFTDLNFDQAVDEITQGRDEYELKPYFYTRLTALDQIAARHEVFRDLEGEGASALVESFAEQMRRMRRHLGLVEKVRHLQESQAWFLSGAEIYCHAVKTLVSGLEDLDPNSERLRAFQAYLSDYVASQPFRGLVDEAKKARKGMASVRYLLNIRGRRIKVSRYDDPAPDYTVEIEKTFERFQQGAVKDYRVNFPGTTGLNHVEGAVLGLVAELYPDQFAALAAYCERHNRFVDEGVATFDREIQFYLAYLEHMETIRGAGLHFAYPRLSDESKELRVKDGFDLALAGKLVAEDSTVVPNDFHLEDPERIIVVSGPNQGGKTTFARMFGQLPYLASLGCPVPGSEAALFLFDQLFTHFEKEEDITDLSGKLEDDLIRIQEILDQATPDSVVIMNESLTSTALADARLLGRAVLERLSEGDLLCVYVTFVDELASLNEKTVSMVSTIVPGDPASRTFKVVRRPADGLAYADAIAEKYGLTYKRLRERLRR
jgi:hypothetical protein